MAGRADVASVTTDRHANARDRKRKAKREGRAMRGDRSVFVIAQAIVKRGRAAREG